MKCTAITLAATALALGVLAPAEAQYAPPPPPAPFAGFINEALRKNDPRMNQWDFGGAVRLRYEAKEGFTIPGVTGSVDFRDHGADVSNEYFLERIRFRASYTDKWWSVLAEGRSSLAQSDDRFAYANNPAVPGTVKRKGDGPESDTLDLHQACLTLGNLKEFPLSLKFGRQELSYGEERLIGAFGWNNLGRVFDAVKLRWQTAWFGADFFASRVVIPEDQVLNVPNDHDWFSGLYATTTNLPRHLLDVYFLAQFVGASDRRRAQPAIPAAQRARHLHLRRPTQIETRRTRPLGLHLGPHRAVRRFQGPPPRRELGPARSRSVRRHRAGRLRVPRGVGPTAARPRILLCQRRQQSHGRRARNV